MNQSIADSSALSAPLRISFNQWNAGNSQHGHARTTHTLKSRASHEMSLESDGHLNLYMAGQNGLGGFCGFSAGDVMLRGHYKVSCLAAGVMAAFE